MEMFEVIKAECDVYNNFDLLGKKWMLPILINFWKNPEFTLKFSQLSKVLPTITSRVISMRLKELEVRNVVEKVLIDGRGCYKLTDHGKTLSKVFNEVVVWTHETGGCSCDGTCVMCTKVDIV
jgi:DNA-binding HxlR family transcriptional regulator